MPGAIKGLFRGACKALTRRLAGAPAPVRRRRRGEAGRAFAAAKAIVRRAVRLPAQAFAAARFLADTLEWLNYWQDDPGSDSEPCVTSDANRNDLSLRL